jgi:hypothetical protein
MVSFDQRGTESAIPLDRPDDLIPTLDYPCPRDHWNCLSREQSGSKLIDNLSYWGLSENLGCASNLARNRLPKTWDLAVFRQSLVLFTTIGQTVSESGRDLIPRSAFSP